MIQQSVGQNFSGLISLGSKTALTLEGRSLALHLCAYNDSQQIDACILQCMSNLCSRITCNDKAACLHDCTQWGLSAADQDAPCKDYLAVNTTACRQLKVLDRVMWQGFVKTCMTEQMNLSESVGE